MPRTKTNIPANETDAQRFVRLANHRVNNVLTGLKNLGSLGGPTYTSTPEQRNKIKLALVEALTKAMEQMATKDGVRQEFKL